MPSKHFRQMLITFITILIGNMGYALTVKLFLLPAELVTGGTTGIALAVSHVVPIPLSGFIFVFNIVMLIIGLIVLGRQFALTTVVSSFAYPIFLEFFNQVLGDIVLTKDPMLCAIFFGIGIGVSLGLVIRAGASTGGMDIPPLVLNHFFKIPVSLSLYVFDFIILLLQAMFQPVEKILYGILMIFIYTMVLDKLLLLGTTRTEVKVVSDHYSEIRDAILQQLDRGVTLVSAHGGYTGNETEMVFSIISNRELPRLERIIHDIDPDCFMVVSRVNEVNGKGFTIDKEYR